VEVRRLVLSNLLQHFFQTKKIVFLYKQLLYAKREADKVG